MKKIKQSALMISMASILALGAPSSAYAASCGSATAAAIAARVQGIAQTLRTQGIITTILSNFQLSTELLLRQTSATLQGEIGKQTQAMRATQEAIATYELQEELRRESAEMSEKLQQPAFACQTMAMSGGIQIASANARMESQAFTQSRVNAMLNEGSSQKRILASDARSRTKYCSSFDISAGRCNGTPDLVNGDISADFMFKSASGNGLTYDDNQREAVEAYIDRVIGSGPTALPVKCETDQCKAYEEMRKDYMANASMALNSLSEIKSAYSPQTGLAERAGVKSIVNKEDISMMEAVDAFIKMKFSKDALVAAGTATSPETLLRELVQNDAFRLWMDFNNMRQMERIEAMQASELAILNTQHMRAALEAQRAAAIQSAANAR